MKKEEFVAHKQKKQRVNKFMKLNESMKFAKNTTTICNRNQ